MPSAASAPLHRRPAHLTPASPDMPPPARRARRAPAATCCLALLVAPGCVGTVLDGARTTANAGGGLGVPAASTADTAAAAASDAGTAVSVVTSPNAPATKPAAAAVPVPPPLYSGQTPLTANFAFRGRFDMSAPLAPAMAWSNSAVGFAVQGTTQVTAMLSLVPGAAADNTLRVKVDGVDVPAAIALGAASSYVVATGLSPGPHTVWLSKGSEGSHGAVSFAGVSLDAGGKLLPPPVLPQRRMLYMGSSTLSGWGADGDPNVSCTTNAEHSIPRYTSEALLADFHNVSDAAGGIICTFSGGITMLGQRYPQATPASKTNWDASLWRPDVVVVEAGGSDFFMGDSASPPLPLGTLLGYPGPPSTSTQQFPLAAFTAAYRALVDRYRADAPGVTVILVNTKDMNGQSTQLLATTLDQLAASYADGRVLRFDYFKTDIGAPASLYTDWFDMAAKVGCACAGHPNQANALYLSDRLTRFIRATMRW